MPDQLPFPFYADLDPTRQHRELYGSKHGFVGLHGTGALRDNPDERDYQYRTRLGLVEFGTDLPAFKDLTANVPLACWDQGLLGSCTAHAVSGAVVFDQRKQRKPIVMPSRLALYYDARRLLDPSLVTQDSGASLRTAIKAVVDVGAPSEGLWPYNVNSFALEPTADVRADGLKRQGTEYFRIGNGDVGAMRVCIANGFPFVFGMDVYENFQPNGRGVIPYGKGGILGGHAMMAVGYSVLTKRFKVRNSWGPNWGPLHGYAWLPEATFRDQAWDLWTLRKVETGEG